MLTFQVLETNRIEESRNHVHRMYFMGPNTFSEPWHLPHSPPEQVIEIVYAYFIFLSWLCDLMVKLSLHLNFSLFHFTGVAHKSLCFCIHLHTCTPNILLFDVTFEILSCIFFCHRYEAAFNRFVDEINALAAYQWWEGSIYSILSIFAYPLAWSWLQRCRKNKLQQLREFVRSEYDHACLRSCRSRALYEGLKVNFFCKIYNWFVLVLEISFISFCLLVP